MTNEIKEKFLPIGTVVDINGGKIALMITGYCVKPLGKMAGAQGEIENTGDKMFDYSACPYPTGITNSEFNILFNHEDIKSVLYMGLETEIHDEYSKFLKEESAKLANGEKKEEN